MPYTEVNQLYTDIVERAKKQADEVVPEYIETIYNANLADAKAKYPNRTTLKALSEMEHRVSFADAQILVGQLKQILFDAEAEAVMTELAAQPQPKSVFDDLFKL